MELDQLGVLATSPRLKCSAAPPKLLIYIEGPIGVGKSTVLNLIAKQTTGSPAIKVLFEDVDAWTAVDMGDGENLLSSMYNSSLSPAVFQLAVLQSRFAKLVRTLNDPAIRVVISERGPWSEKLVFAASNLAHKEFIAYNYTQQAMLTELFPLVGNVNVHFMYMKLSLDEVMKRIETRGREEEKEVSREYMTKLEAAYDQMEETLRREGLGVSNLTGTTRHVQINASTAPGEVASAIMAVIRSLLLEDDELDAADWRVPEEVAALRTGQTSARSSVSASALSKYESPLTRSESQAESIEAAEQLHDAIAACSIASRSITSNVAHFPTQ